MKNILIITGSPRKNGNSALLAKAFMEGAERAGNKVTLFDAAKKKVHPCIACDICLTKGRCVYNNDFSELIPTLEEADVIVLATLLYWFTFSAQLKLVIDRMYSLQLQNKKSVLIVSAATDDMKDFEGVVSTYGLIHTHLEWKNRAILNVPNVNGIGEVMDTDWLEKAKEIGLTI